MSELLNLVWSKVGLEDQVIQPSSAGMFESKSGKERVVPFSGRLVEMLEAKPQMGSMRSITRWLPV